MRVFNEGTIAVNSRFNVSIYKQYHLEFAPFQEGMVFLNCRDPKPMPK